MENNQRPPTALEGGDFDAMMTSDQKFANERVDLAPPVQAPMAPSPDQPVIQAAEPIAVQGSPSITSRLEGADFDAMMKSDKDAELAQTKINFLTSETKDPAQAAEAYNLSIKAKTDPSFAERNFDQLKSGIAVNEIDFNKLSRLHPSIAKLANDPVKAAAIRDQVTELSKFDNAVKDHTLVQDAYNMVGYSISNLAGNVTKIPAAMFDILALKENARRWMRNDPTRVSSDDYFFGRHNPVTEYLEDSAKGFRKDLPILDEQTHQVFLKTVHSAANASFPERVVDAVTQGDYVRGGQVLFAQTAAFAPTILAIMGASFVNPTLGPAMFGATSLAEHNAANKEAGVDPLVGTPNAMIHGAVAGYFTQFGVNSYFSTLGGRLSAKFGPEVTKQVMKAYGASLIKAVGAEAGTMAGMSLSDDFADYVTGTNPNALQGAIGRAVDAGLMGGLTGGVTHGVGETVVKTHQARSAVAVRDFVADLIERSKNKVSERSPELHNEFVRESVSGTEAESVQISPEAVETYFQSKGVNPVQAMQDLGFLKEFGHAKDTGTNLKIPTEKFIDYVSKNGHQDLVNDIKLNEETMSVNETNAQAEVEAAFNRVDDEGIRKDEINPLEPSLNYRGLTPDQSIEEQAESIRKEFARQLTEAGQDPTQAVVLSKIFQTQAERVGVTPAELYNKYLVRIKGEALTGEGRVFNQGETDGSQQAFPQSEGEAGQRQGTGRGQGALSEAVRAGAEKLPNLPSSSSGGVAGVRDRARAYVESRGREYRPQSEYVTVDPGRAARIADEYERMEHRPNDPDVKEAYDAMINETLDQYQSLKESGLKIEAIKEGQENPYPNGSADMMKDIADGHLWFFPTDQGFGTETVSTNNPLLHMTEETLADGTKLKANDIFRIVHDYFGHAKEGVSFGANGEENAWQSHVRMYSPLAARAMTTETRGQNSWVNFGPKGEANRADPGNTSFADQKTGLLPEWVTTEGMDRGRRTLFQTDLPQPAIDPLGFFSQVDAELGKMDFKAMPANDLLNRIKNIQGIKKEELEALGLEDYLKLRAESGQKVTKDEVQSFVRDNGLKVEQVVLGPDYIDVRRERERQLAQREYDNDNLRRRRQEAVTVDDVHWDREERDTSGRSDDISNELESYDGADSDYWDDERTEWMDENREEHTDEDGNVDEKALKKGWERALEKIAYERAAEYVDSDEYHGVVFNVYENASGTYIHGSDEYGWRDSDGNELGGNLNEAQIQHVNNLLENGDLGYPSDPDAETDEEVEKPTSQEPLPEIQTPDSMRGINPVSGKSRFERYSVDGAKNYREVLLKLPGNEFHYPAHFAGQKGILAHIRISDRVDASGKKTLFLEEVQSDLHQQGREKGYQDDALIKDLKDDLDLKNKELLRLTDVEEANPGTANYALEDAERAFDSASASLTQAEHAIPDAPFKATDAWASLALKRMLRMAVEEGYDSIAWTPADVHIERWGTDDVTWVKTPERYRLEFVDPEVQAHAKRVDRGDGKSVPSMIFTDKAKLDEFMSHGSRKDSLRVLTEPAGFLVGSAEQRGGNADDVEIEDLARQRGELLERRGERVTTKEELREQIGKTLGRERDDRSLDALTDRVWKQMESGDQSGALQPRAEGMKFFYDKVIPDTFKKILKKIDPAAKIEVGKIKTDGTENYRVRQEFRTDDNKPTFIVKGPDGEAFGSANYDEAVAEANRLNESMPAGMDTLHIKLTDTLKKTVAEKGLSLFQKTDGTPRGQIQFGKNGADISLFANANRSTFFHEVGHFSLEMMKDMASIEDAPAQIKEDLSTIMTFLGNEGGEITTDQHEKFARGFEEYIMEGKAPSSALARAFTRFKTWLVDVYKTLRNNDVELSDDVRKVFDRLLATDAEIERAQSIQEIKPLFTEGTLPKGVHERYMKAFENAQLAAHDELRGEIMEDIRKEETDLYKQEFEESVARVTERVKKMPVYQALSILQRGQTLDDTPLRENLRDLKINREAFVKEFGKDVADKLPKPSILSKEGTHHDLVSDLLGYETPKAMVEDFTSFPKMSEYIDQEAKADMQVKNPDLFKSTYLPEVAMAAIHNDKRADVLRMELDMLREKSPGVVRDLTERVMKRPMPARELRESMESVVGQQVVSDLAPNKYRVAERQAGREAAKAFANGDFQAAFDAKTKELKNYQLFKSATEAKTDMEKSMKFFKKLGLKDEKIAKTRDMNLVNTARAVLASYGIGKTEAAPMDYLQKMKDYDPQAFESAAHHVFSATEGGQAQNYKQLTYGQFRNMADSVKALYQLAKSSKEVELLGKKLLREDVVNSLIDVIAKHGDITAPRPGTSKAITTREKGVQYLSGAKASLRRVEHYSHAMDGNDYGGAFVKTLVEPVKAQETGLHLKKAEVMKEYRDEVVSPAAETFEKRDIEAPEIGYTFGSKQELLAALRHIGNKSNLSKLLRGRGWGEIREDGTLDRSRWDQMVDRFHQDGTLTKLDYDYVQRNWDLYDKLKPDSQKAFFKINGRYFNEITNDPFMTPFGEYKGGYVPAMADPNMNEDAMLRRERESFGTKNDMTMVPTTGRGFTKGRIEEYAAPLALDLRLIPMEIDKFLRFTYMEPVVSDLVKIVTDRRFANALSAVDPAARSEMLMPYLDRAARQSTTSPSGTGKGYKILDTAFRKMRGNTGLNAMTLNVVNAFHQLTGFSVAAALVEPKYLRDATLRYTMHSTEVTEAMHEKSDYMRAKESGIGDLQSDIEELMNDPGKFTKTMDWIKKNSYVLQKFSAGTTETVAWVAAYDKAVAEGKTEKEAVAFGDSVVRRTQHSASPTDVSRFGTGNPMQRLFTMYFDYFNNKANLNLTQAGNLTRQLGMKKGLLHMAPLYVATMMIPAIMTKMALKGAAGEFDENDDGQYMDDAMKLFFHSQFDEALTSLPVLGPAVTAGINTFNDNPSDDRMSLSPAIETGMRMLNAPRHITDFAHGKGKPSKAIRDVFSLVGLFSGVPIQPLAKPIGYAADVASGAVESRGPLDYARGLITGVGPRR